MPVTSGWRFTGWRPYRAGGTFCSGPSVWVAGIDLSPMRVYAYLDSATAAPLVGLPGMTNMLTVLPSAGYSAADVQRALLNVPHVASAQSVRAATRVAEVAARTSGLASGQAG